MEIFETLKDLESPVFWLLISGFIFLTMTIIVLLGYYLRQKDDLMTAFLGFLAGMSAFHILGGFAMFYENPILMYLASFGAMTGSAFVMKFPLTAIMDKKIRQTLFMGSLAIAWILVIWMFAAAQDPMTSMKIASVYMIVFSGAISGTYIIWRGLHLKERSVKVKCIGGGCSLWLCCFLTHLIVITIGMTALAKLFMVMTPITLSISVIVARMMSKPEKTPNLEHLNGQ